MTLRSPALQAAHDKLIARRAVRSALGPASRGVTGSRHPELKLAYAPDGATSYFIVRYCTACLRGTVIDLKRGMTDLPSARELGLRQSRQWSLECNLQN